ncbi:hypothetical protein JN853_26625 [Pseudomonas syringae pv. actinidiae ICMP 9853]|nr:hypothetical protein JN853_26625 [Pseudomonas syringae pv. actinidiae ICMP 9853]AQX57652.1 hypothetical protein B1R35_05405 [Pseudomonas syringae pv. actinidiae]AQX63548.1 hypothetical protein B1F85_05405 [Pseudomonas syringae pv. actinidiae]NAT27927.1 hypothetical protein [Pseudomonas syringae pv. actinidiae]PBK47900.1 hypothetical protein BUE61_27700 [Pseudomonas syringae pv. actinidiae]
MPTRSVGTIVFLRTPIVPHAPAWECISGRSASNLDQRCGEVCDAERHERHANAERRHDNQPQKRPGIATWPFLFCGSLSEHRFGDPGLLVGVVRRAHQRA